ncbi:MAG TPA: hypothetical protein PLK35_01855 [Candidatus Moranbacteria bacterium]|nr:hypothetical protein [Candidatus Moranbacteria bacterium]
MINYIELLVAINRACLNCQKSKRRKNKEYFQETLFSALSALNAASSDQFYQEMISAEFKEEVFDYICHLSLACNDCKGNGEELRKALSPYLKEARKRALKSMERIERKELAKKAVAPGGKVIDFHPK